MVYFWLIPIIPLTIGLIYVRSLKDILEEKGLLKLGLQKSELAKVNMIRGFLLLAIIIFLIYYTRIIIWVFENCKYHPIK